MPRVSVNRQGSALELERGDFGALEFDAAREYEITRVKKGVYVLTEGAERKGGEAQQHETAQAQQGARAQQPQHGAHGQTMQQPAAQHDAAREKIVKFLSDKKMLPQRVVGRFEKTLNAEELKRFNAMLASGEVEKFRLSPKYRNAVYQLSEKNKGMKGSAAQAAGSQEDAGSAAQQVREQGAGTGTGSQSNTAPNSGQQGTRAQGGAAPNPQQQSAAKPDTKSRGADAPHLEPTLDRDGYLVVQNEGLAKQISMDRAEDIKRGELTGLRSFDGPFYVMKNGLYRNVRRKIENALEKNRTMPLEALAKELNTEKTVIKIACEFMKEDGSLLEKRRGIYRLC